jgi:hypothetical protein
LVAVITTNQEYFSFALLCILATYCLKNEYVPCTQTVCLALSQTIDQQHGAESLVAVAPGQQLVVLSSFLQPWLYNLSRESHIF